MSDGFKLFIDTRGKSKDEIKRGIRQLLEHRTKESENPSAPPRAEKSDGEIRKKIEYVAEISHKDYVYSSQPIPPREEISYVTGKVIPEPKTPPFSLPQNLYSISPSDSDRAINAIITEMRSLNEIYYNGYMLKQCAQISMVRQGEFLAELDDNYEHCAFCGISRPVYSAMSNSQLRTYITWRTKARQGKYEVTDEPYVMLYCYELLNKIGVNTSAQAFAKLLEVNENCGEFAGEVKKLFPRWIKDFYAYNDISAEYPDINEVIKTTCGVKNDEDALRKKEYFGRLSYLMDNSAYDLAKSAFFSEETKPLLDGAVGAALAALDGWLDERGVSLFELICGKMKKQFGWEPFKGAFVNLDRMDGFRAVKISEVERYCIKRGEPVLECFEAIPYRGFIGYVLKRVEAVVRRQTGYRHKITPNANMLQNDLCNREKIAAAVSDPEFEKCIDDAAERWCGEHGVTPPKKQRAAKKSEPAAAPEKPIHIEIDLGRLAKIREESDEMAKRLIIEEDGLAEDEIAQLSEQIDSDDYNERVTAFAQPYEESYAQSEEPQFDFSELPAAWRDFAQSLSADELAVLSALLRSAAEDVCRNRGLFPEMVYERINTAALETVGDIVIDCAEIIDDYIGDIKRIAKIVDE